MTSTDSTTRRGVVTTEITDHIGWIVFDNPSRRNALSVDMMADTHKALRAFDADPEVAVVILRGAGDEAFASGVDISEFKEQHASVQAQRRFDDTAAAVFEVLRQMSTPTIAMIHGFCLGGGLAVALGADIRIASLDSTFAIPAARLGLGYPRTNTDALIQIVGPAHAAEILFSASRLDADEAQKCGLVNRVVPSSDLTQTVTAVARAIAANAPLTIRAAKASIRASRNPDDSQLKQVADEAIRICAGSNDVREGQQAFMEKRAPRFTGR